MSEDINLNKWKGYWYTFDPDLVYKIKGENKEDFEVVDIFSGEVIYTDLEKFSDIATSDDWENDFVRIPDEIIKNPKENAEKLKYEEKTEITSFYVKLIKEGEPEYI